MKHLFLLLIFVISLYSNAFSQPEKKAKSEVKSVIVFLQKAQVTLEARAEAEAGTSKLVISGVPGNLSNEEIHVKGRGDGTITSVSYRLKNPNLQHKSREIVLLEDSIEHLQAEMDSLIYTVEALQKEEKFLLSNEKIGGANVGVKATELEDVADFYRERLPSIKMVAYRIERKKEKISEKLERLRPRLDNYYLLRNKTNGEVVVTMSANSKTPVVLEVDYLTNDAGWNPVYDLKAKSTKDPLTIIYKAEVYQNTGVNWDNVRLTLSSASPVALSEKPKLPVWGLEFNRPMPLRREKTMQMKQSEVDDKVLDEVVTVGYGTLAGATPNMATMEQEVSVSSSYYSVVYEVNTPYTVHSDVPAQLVDIKSANVTPLYSHFSVPKISQEVYVTAAISGWDKLNLLSGKANIFFGGAYVGATYIDPSQLNDTLAVVLNKDNNVTIARELVKDFSSKKLIGTNKTDEFGYLITIKNNNKEPVKLTLQDQIPVSRDSQIEVSYINESNANYNSETGALQWSFQLDASETKKIFFKFAVKYPKDKAVRGL